MQKKWASVYDINKENDVRMPKLQWEQHITEKMSIFFHLSY